MKTLLTFTLALIPFALRGQESAPLPGKAAFDMNCAACHFLDVKTVGPSLVTMAETYPAEQLAAFVEWAKTPGKKDPNMIQMPSMAHVPEAKLAEIHAYILDTTEGKTEKKGRHQFAPFKEPKRELPYVVRTFLPDASPASLAVVLKDNLSLCWDAEACRLRYVWPGSKTNVGAGRGPAELPELLYQETAPQLWSFAAGAKPDFLGYRLVNKYPEFNYTIGGVEVRERVANGSKPGTIIREFALTGVEGPVTLDLAHAGNVSIATDKGALKGNVLSLSPKQAKSFRLTLSFK